VELCDLANRVRTTVAETRRRSWTPAIGGAPSWPGSRLMVDSPGPARPPAVEHRKTCRALTAPLDREDLDGAQNRRAGGCERASGSGSGLRPQGSDDSPDSFHGATPWSCPRAPNGCRRALHRVHGIVDGVETAVSLLDRFWRDGPLHRPSWVHRPANTARNEQPGAETHVNAIGPRSPVSGAGVTLWTALDASNPPRNA
jgi:hypothetical protein